MIKFTPFKDSGMIRHLQINKCNSLPNGLKGQHPLTISRDKEKAFNQIQTYLMLKVLQKLEIERI